MNSMSHYAGSESDSIDLRLVIEKLWDGKWWVAGIASLVVFLTAIVAFTMTPIYRASAVLVASSNGRDAAGGGLSSALGQLGGLASLAGVSLSGGGSGTEEALAVLRSREFTERFVNELNLMPELFYSSWDSSAATWKKNAKTPTPGKAFRKFNSIRTVSQDKKTGLVTLQVDWRDRIKAAEWVNELVKRLNEEMRIRAIASSTASLGYLEKELSATAAVDTREAVSRLIEAQVKQRMLANVSQEYSFRVIDRAIAPDADDKLRPKRLLMLIFAAVAGFVMGSVGILLGSAYKRPQLDA